jgi:hypothetical protein
MHPEPGEAHRPIAAMERDETAVRARLPISRAQLACWTRDASREA